jgi:hypothetical protein
LIAGGDIVTGRKYPWAGGFFYSDEFQCGGNLSKLFKVTVLYKLFEFFNIFSKSKTRFICGPLFAGQRTDGSQIGHGILFLLWK